MKKNFKNIVKLALFLCVCALAYWDVTSLFKDNPVRLYNIRAFKTYDDETFSIIKGKISLGERTVVEEPDRKEIGPLPEGKFISAFIKEGTDTYYYEYSYPVGYNEPYGYFGYKSAEFKYTTNLSVYDISDQISLLEREDSAYLRMMKDLKSRVTEYKNWSFNPLDGKAPSTLLNNKFYEGRGNALTYVTRSQDGRATLRSVYFANKKAYVFEVKANHKLLEIANAHLANITTADIKSFNNSVLFRIILLPVLICILTFIFIVTCIKPYIKTAIKNKHANTLYKWAIWMTIINIVIMMFITIWSFSNSDFQFVYYGKKCIYLDVVGYITIATLVIMSLLICPYLNNKRKEEHRFDYLIPNKLQTYLDSRLDNVQERRALVSFLCYPLFTIGVMPFGIFILAYVIPFSLILTLLFEIRHLFRWIGDDSSSANSKKEQSFLDYYVLLDLKRDADKNEIEMAFNSAMSKYNSANGNPLYGKRYYNEIQEAYAVLSSSNQLRPEYDKEYDIYKSSNNINYEFANKQLENEIKQIRSRLYGYKNKNENKMKINIVYLSLIIFLFATFVVLKIMGIIPPPWEETEMHHKVHHTRYVIE
ncbi:MAG: DnaJ domain-containing protein [Prevotella sp.]|nr:DnaJ domain-containing protein [Prevotella sp.]